MSPYCYAPLDLTTNHDIIAACIQAEAGFAQAAASTRAGWITVGAGVFVLVAAVLSAWATIRSVREQIAAAAREQSRQRAQDIKREAFRIAIDAVAAGMQTVVQLASLNLSVEVAIKPYMEETVPRLLTIHLVATSELAKKWQGFVVNLGKEIGILTFDRPTGQIQAIGLERSISWSRECTDVFPGLIDALIEALAEMRAELELPFDKDQYRQIIVEGYKRALKNNEEIYRRMFARLRGQG